MSNDNLMHPFGNSAVSIITACCLALCLFAAGFLACALPDAPTEGLSRAFSNEADSPYDGEQLTFMAVAAKHYTFNDNDRARLDAAQNALEASLQPGKDADGGAVPDAAATSAPASDAAATDDASASDAGFAAAIPASQAYRYRLDDESLSHLDDVFAVALTAYKLIALAACIAAAGLTYTGLRRGSRYLGRILVGGGAAVLAILAALGLWAVADFNGLFSAMHGLFFADGSWTFPYDSLLICMYPITFWIGMGGLWLAVSVILSILSIVIGCLSIRRSRLAPSPFR